MHKAIVAGLVMLAGPALAEEQLRLSSNNHAPETLACYERYATALDDGKSDPRSIGAAVISQCRGVRMKELRTRGVSESGIAQAVNGPSREGDVDAAAAAVLFGRTRTQR